MTIVASSPSVLPTVAIVGLAAVGAGVVAWAFWPRGEARGGTRGGARGNPAGADGSSGRSKPIVKGRSCLFEMVDGSDVRCSGGMIHDPSGRRWPRRSVLCGPFRSRTRKATDDEYTGAARHYLGGSYGASIGRVDMPPKALGAWDYLGEVDRIYYTRTGRRNPGRYQHQFNKSTALAVIFKGRGKVRLYRRGRFVRLELPPSAILDSRGYVWP
jgi:hypothetical protein